MKLYHVLSNINLIKRSYTSKFLFVAFLGIHIPLIGLIVILIFNKNIVSTQAILLFTLIFTLLATAITLYIINKLMMPIKLATKTLSNYKQHRKIPQLPTEYSDEAGQLLCNIQDTIIDNENHFTQKQDLIYLLTHDIKTFASHPIALAELIEDEKGFTDSMKEYTTLIKYSAEQQIGFLESFIQLLREEDNLSRTEIKPSLINFDDVLNDIQNQLAPKLNEKNIIIKVNSEIKSVKLLINELLFSRVVFNLIHNALKFSYPDSSIIIKAYTTNNFLEVIVSDNGLGFKPTIKDYLFSKFSNVSRKGTSNEKSTGIGLYLCRQIVTKFEGYIDANSDGEDKGAVFTVGFKISK